MEYPMTQKFVTTLALLIFLMLAIAVLVLINAYNANLSSPLGLHGMIFLYPPVHSLL